MPDPRSENSVGRCASCHFDHAAWNEEDTANTLALVDDFIKLALEGFPRPWGHYDQALTTCLDRLQASRGTEPAEIQLHTLFHELHRIALLRHEAEDIVAMNGSVHQVNGSGGGVPKEPVLSAVVDRGGLVGDRQATRRHHGRPWQALCLWSTDVIEELVAEGHPTVPGGAGENLTLTGIDWAAMRTGLHLCIGDIHAVLSSPAAPCSKVGRNFSDRQFSRIDHDLHPGSARWYASVISGGAVAPGDTVTISSSAPAAGSAEGR